jgi:hypothetical protein
MAGYKSDKLVTFDFNAGKSAVCILDGECVRGLAIIETRSDGWTHPRRFTL